MKLVSNIIGHDDLNEMDTKATTWINTNNLREHLDDQLLNSLLDMAQMPESFIISKKAAQGEAESETFVKDNFTSAKSKIQELSKDFGGSLSDKDLMAITGVSRNTYYKYKRELISERVG